MDWRQAGQEMVQEKGMSEEGLAAGCFAARVRGRGQFLRRTNLMQETCLIGPWA
ncbi:MAG: hypothetical protein J0M24_02415 [Verrucomicrobia bacterium]|nr:hypothetical protein [Verrucomicrobiota bacterium]